MPQKLEVSKPNQWFRMDGREEAGAERSEHGLGLGRPLGIRLCPASPGQVREGHLECSLSPSQLVSGSPKCFVFAQVGPFTAWSGEGSRVSEVGARPSMVSLPL